jgi:antitoxin component of MazEF toxin-antitoxin module
MSTEKKETEVKDKPAVKVEPVKQASLAECIAQANKIRAAEARAKFDKK